MEGRNIDWKKDFSEGTVFKVPPDYFEGLPDRIMDRIHKEGHSSDRAPRVRTFNPWMAWVSGAAAILVIGWFGFRTLFFQADQEKIRQQQIAYFIDYYGDDFNEGHLAGFIEEAGFEIVDTEITEYDELIEDEPDHTEALIYESIIY